MKNFSTFKRFFCVICVLTLTIGLIGCKKGKTDTDPDITSAPTSAPSGTDLSTATPTPDTDPGSASSGGEVDASGEYLVRDVDLSDYAALTSADNSRVFYHIFVGSFSDSDGDGIGDLRGIINRIDYLNDGDPKSGKSLGVEGIWLSPIFMSPSYHKYDTTDYYKIDDDFGTMDDLKELADLCEARGIKLILDLVINHTGKYNDWFVDFKNAHATGDTASPYYDFYTWNATGSEGGRSFQRIQGSDHFYECNFSGDMPELNYDNPAVYDAMLEVARYYLEDIGVDGFRFDAAKYIYFGENKRSGEFWVRYMNDLRAINPDVYTVAEVWDADSVVLNYEPALDCFNFSMAQAEGMIASAAKKGDVNTYTSYIEYYLGNIREKRSSASLVSFIANHDMDRAAGYLTNITGYAKMGASLYLLNPGSSFIYYGEEIGMKGSRGSANTDSNRRLAMLWGDGDTVKDPVGTTFEKDKQSNGTVAEQIGRSDSLLSHYKQLILIRKANPEIASGEYHALKIEGSKAGGFVSTLNGSAVAVFHNTTGSTVTVDLGALCFTDGSPITSLFNTASAKVTAAVYCEMAIDHKDVSLEGTVLTLPAQSSAILR
ncbi:MAG: hypothetical protein IK001_06025 [Lachnospiraceae bacterium]|nr:hypothetical protein [Lachnospiraceae bacterium]